MAAAQGRYPGGCSRHHPAGVVPPTADALSGALAASFTMLNPAMKARSKTLHAPIRLHSPQQQQPTAPILRAVVVLEGIIFGTTIWSRTCRLNSDSDTWRALN